MAELHLAADLSLPPEAVTETFAILAKRGVGKTYTASVMAEEMRGLGAQIVILDPLDAWWGLRSTADGKGEGLPIFVFGGEHGDLPLEAGAGAQLADIVVEEGISVICSLRHLSKERQRQFVAEFAERLYHRKGEPEHRTPLHVFIDEADAFVPQRVTIQVARVHGAIDDLVRRGRSSGIGVTLISQRAAVVSKDVLTQAEVLIALRTVSPQDRKALDAWVEAHDVGELRQTFMESLASLAVGEAWVWSPGWLDIFQRVRIRERRTFDSSATPRAGQRAAVPTKRTALDLDQLRTRMADAVARQQADDPKLLRKRIAELERTLAQRPAERVERVERVEVPVLNGQVGELRGVVGELVATGDKLAQVGASIIAALDRAAGLATPVDGRVKQAPRGVAAPPATAGRSGSEATSTSVAATPVSRPRPAPARSEGSRTLGKGERAILSVLAQYPEGRSKRQVAFLSGYSVKGGRFNNLLSALRSAGLIEGTEQLQLTIEGFAAVPDVEPLPTGAELIDYWLGRLGKGEAAILAALCGAYPRSLTKAELGAMAGYEPSGGRFNNLLSALRTLELIEGSSELRASSDLFT